MEETACFGPKLKLLAHKHLICRATDSSSRTAVDLYGLGGSVLDYTGDVIVNAANTGGIGGFGVDEMVNRSGGNELKQARKLLGGIPTGSCKSTASFGHSDKVKYIIHAVGPVLRQNALSTETLDVKLGQLEDAYFTSLEEATCLGCRDVGFCLLSCGVFRGDVPLEVCLERAVRGIKRYFDTNSESSSLAKVCLIAYNEEEQQALQLVIEKEFSS